MAKKKEVSTDKFECFKCREPKGQNDYYESRSVIFIGVKKLPICKECVNDLYIYYLEKYKDKKDAMYKLCEKLDMPFHHAIFNKASEKTGKDISKHYFRVLNSFRDKNSYADDFDGGESIVVKPDSLSNIESEDFEINEEITVQWGRGMENWEYEFLEKELYNLKTDFECEDYGMEMIMRDIAFINLEIYKSRQQERKDVSKLIETRSKLMNDANLKPVQSTGASQNEKLSFGVFIKKWENEKPIKRDLDDEMKKYIDTFMVGHLAKMQGYNNEATKLYDKSIKDETINFSDLYKDDDGED